jgi:hypothetical protein
MSNAILTAEQNEKIASFLRDHKDEMVASFKAARPEVIVPPECQFFASHYREVIETVQRMRDAPQPMQDALIPLLEANGFCTKRQQDDNMRCALLRAAALDPMMTGDERVRYARRFGVSPLRRAWWWVRRQHSSYSG